MRISAAALLLCIGIISCSDSVGPGSALPGTWSTGRMSLGSRRSWEEELTFSADGEFTQRVTTYGAYSGQSEGERSAETVIAGTYAIEGTRLEMVPATSRWWDAFYQEPGPHTADPPDTLYADCTFELRRGIVLTLQYVSYPADAPVETERSFYRLR